MKKTCLALAGLCLALLTQNSNAQVSLSAGGYAQDFDSLPNDSVARDNPWENNVTLLGWYANAPLSPVIFGTGGAATNILGTNGAISSGALYSYGTIATSERALGAIGANGLAPSGSPAIAFGVRFLNDTGVPLTNFVVAYTGEQWRNAGVTAVQQLTFGYRVDGAAITSSDPTSTATWNTASGLAFPSPTVGTTAAALDGNSAPNRTAIGPVALTGFVVLPGQEIFLRWSDLNDSGNDHGLSIDDLTVSFETNLTATATAPTINTDPVSVVIGEGMSATFTVDAGGTEPLAYDWYSTNSGGVTQLGITATSLVTNFVPIATDGTGFFVIVNNSEGSVTSLVATLTVTNLPPEVTTIQYLRTLLNANFLASDTNTLFEVEGIVTTPVNLVSGATPVFSFHIQDGTYGIDVFHRGGFSPDLPSLGDSVRVTAQLLNFSGLLELSPISANPTHKLEVLSNGNTIPATNYFDFSALNPSLVEGQYEGSLVVVSNVFIGLTNGTVVLSGSTMFMTNLSGQVLRLVNPTPAIDPQGQTPPAFAASVQGVLSQNTGSLPATNNYSILLTLFSDIVAGTAPAPAPTPVPLTITTSGTDAIVSWTDPTGLFTLASSTDVTQVTNKILGATSPYTNAISGSATYFRLVYP